MHTYKERSIRFLEISDFNDWKVKIYVIQKEESEIPRDTIERIKREIPSWLKMENSFNSSHVHLAFLVIHFGTEGIFSIINWWVGGEMLNTHVFLTPYDNHNIFNQISGDGLAPCIWELEVINHERIALITHILKKMPNPDYDGYLSDVTNVIL